MPQSAPGTILDSHVHTVRGAADSELQPADLLAEARRRGLSGINVSEHDRVWERPQWEAFVAEAPDLFISQGMEVSTDLGHVVVFGIDRYHPASAPASGCAPWPTRSAPSSASRTPSGTFSTR